MATSTDLPKEKIQEQVDRILTSRSFEGVERLRRFLSFIVAETLAGRGDQLKEFAVGEYAFEKGVDFDPRNDPIVRVQARRLRSRLARYQTEEGQSDEIIVDLPKGGYVPVFRRRETHAPRRPMTAVLLDRNSVIVVPFDNQSSDPEITHLCQGITQEVTHAITKVEGLMVAAFSGRTIADALDNSPAGGHASAATVISGSVQKRGERLRISYQVIDSASGAYVWSESVDRRTEDDLFQIEDDIARLISDRLREGVLEHRWNRRDEQTPKNLAAYNFYLQGQYQLEQRTEESLLQSVALFEKAIAEDSQFSRAHAALANAYELLGHYGALAPVEVWTKAPSNAGLAVLLDDRSAEAHTSLAHVRSTQDWDWTGAEHEFRRALELDPRNATAHHWYAVSCLAPMGRLDEALASMQVARALAPLSCIIARDCARVHYYRREYELALEHCDHAIELNTYFSQAYWTLGFIQEQRREFTEAEAAFNRALQLAPRSPRCKAGLARILALIGKKKDARRLLRELQELSQTRYVSPLELATIHFALEEEELGFQWMSKAFKDRSYELLAIKVDPQFDPLKSNPVFLDLASQLGLPSRSG